MLQPFKGLFMWRWGTQISEVTCGRSPHLSHKRDQIKMRDYMDRQVTPLTMWHEIFAGSIFCGFSRNPQK